MSTNRQKQNSPTGNTAGAPDRRRFSILEILIWMIGVSTVLSAPAWIGDSSISVIFVFYGTLITVMWRLSKLITPLLALFAALVVAIGVVSLINSVMVN